MNNQQVWFTSDLHFFHKNILKFLKRPAETLDEMNWKIIHEWNNNVKPHDHVYSLGDLTFGNFEKTKNIIQQLNGMIHLIHGNHCNDKLMARLDKELPNVIDHRTSYHEINVENQKIIMCHYPIISFNHMHRGAIHIHGHCHNSLRFKGKMFPGKMLDVGIDSTWENFEKFRPINFDELMKFMDKREIKGYDHH